jgi:hypothetical protein
LPVVVNLFNVILSSERRKNPKSYLYALFNQFLIPYLGFKSTFNANDDKLKDRLWDLKVSIFRVFCTFLLFIYSRIVTNLPSIATLIVFALYLFALFVFMGLITFLNLVHLFDIFKNSYLDLDMKL